MAVVRSNISTNAGIRDQYIEGVKLLKKEASGRTTDEFGIPGAARSVSTYDLFVVWHVTAMMIETPPGNPAQRNSAHRGPIFAPWHRVMLMIFEQNLQRVLNDANFGLPYWDWAEDGDLPPQEQSAAAIWGADCMGGEGNPVSTGPFAFQRKRSIRVQSAHLHEYLRRVAFGEPRPPTRLWRQRRRAAENGACDECAGAVAL